MVWLWDFCIKKSTVSPQPPLMVKRNRTFDPSNSRCQDQIEPIQISAWMSLLYLDGFYLYYIYIYYTCNHLSIYIIWMSLLYICKYVGKGKQIYVNRQDFYTFRKTAHVQHVGPLVKMSSCRHHETKTRWGNPKWS